MSKENNKDAVSNTELVQIFQENDATLVGLVNKIKNIYANTLMPEKRIKIDALRKDIVNEDITCQLKKIDMLTNLLKEIE